MKITTGYSTLGRIALGAGALSFLPSVEAAFAQCGAGWEWSYNSKGQNPCEIAGSLQAPCLGFSIYELAPLSAGSNYVTPQRDDTEQKKCGCNSIIYSLYAACAVCQGNGTTIPITWEFWAQFCDSVYVTQYPFDIPYNASVPRWTFLNYTSGAAFDPVLARAAGRDPEATPTAPPIVTISSTTPNSPPSTNPLTGIANTPASGTGTSSLLPSTSSGGSSGGDNSGGTKTNVAAIAGGVAGGVVGLAGFAGLAFFFLRRRRENGGAINITTPDQTVYSPTMVQPTYDQPKIYNPADPSTFPSPVPGGESSHSGGITTSSYQPGRYNGAAEL